MDDFATTTSPTRKYLAICLDENRKLSLRKFSIPELFDGSKLENDSSMATWYFANLLDVDATITGCIALEDVEAAPWFNLADVRENPLLMRVSAEELEADAA
jgi:hypothetical protein